MPAISVIIPVYNTSPYIHRCLDSVLAQSFQDFEVILVDDGSTDDSPGLCDNYAKKDSRVQVFHKQNEGLPATRRYGLQHSCGGYIIHIDSDDWIEPDMLQMMYDEAVSSDADIVICEYWLDYGSNKKNIQNRFKNVSDSRQVLKDCLNNSTCFIWNRLVRRECYGADKVIFPENLTYFEDRILNAQLLTQSVRVAYIPKSLYHYMQNPTSMMHKSQVYVLKMLKQSTNWLEKYLGSDFSEEISYIRYQENAVAFRLGLISKADFYKVNVPFGHRCRNMKMGGLWFKFCLFLANIGLFYLGQILWQIKYTKYASENVE